MSGVMPEVWMARHTIGLNYSAIGVENVGGGGGIDNLTRRQIRANTRLVRHLKEKHPTIDYLIAHSEYRQLERSAHPAHDLFYEELPEYRTEKSDPGRRFMRRLRRMLRQSAGKPVG